MAKKKPIDGVVETVRYSKNGEIVCVRAYERRGPTYSDVQILSRDDLINKINSGMVFYTGSRIPLEASTFVTSSEIRIAKNNGRQIIHTENASADTDLLPGVPIF